MADRRQEYNKLMADLCSKGLGGIVQQIDPYYKNEIHVGEVSRLSTPTQKTKNEIVVHTPKTKNERAAVGQTAARLPFEVTT